MGLLWPQPAGAQGRPLYAVEATRRQTGDGWLGLPSAKATGLQLGAVPVAATADLGLASSRFAVRQADHRDLFWSLTGSPWHVAYCVQGTIPAFNSNYVLCRVVWPDGGYRYVAGMWFDEWCELAVEAGDTAGTPLRVRFRSVNPAGACAPGAGVYPWVDPWYATATEGYVFPRNASDPWSRGAVVEIR